MAQRRVAIVDHHIGVVGHGYALGLPLLVIVASTDKNPERIVEKCLPSDADPCQIGLPDIWV